MPAAPQSISPAPAEARRVSSLEIWRLAWPQVLMMFFQFLVGLTDVWVAGQIHRDVQAVLGLVTRSQFVFLIVGIAVANASVAAMSQSLGAGLETRARRYAGLALKMGLAFAFAVLALALLFRRPLLAILQTPEEIRPLAEGFWPIFLASLPSNYLLSLTGAMFRARKVVFIPLATSAMAFALNAVTSTGLGLGWWGLPAFGANGIAISTFISITVMACINVIILNRRGVLVKKSFAPWRWEKKALPYLVKVAVPAGAMQVSWQVGYLVLVAVTASLPYDSVNALAGMTAGMYVESILFLPAFAFNMTGSMLVGHCLGAGDKAEAKRVGWRIILAGSGAMTLAALILWPFIKDIAAFIVPDPDAQAHAIVYLRYNLLATPCSVASMTLGGVMTGAGATIYSFAVFGTAIWLVRLPLAWLFGHIIWQNSEGVFMAMFLSQVFQSVVMLYIFHVRDWGRFAMIRRHVRT